MADEDVNMDWADNLGDSLEGYDDDFDDEFGYELDDGFDFDQQIPARPKECSICCDQRDDLTLIAACQHEVCPDCQRRAFRLAMRDEERYPPTCCGTGGLSIQLAAQVLDAQEFQAYRDRVEEMEAEERLYCAAPTCSKFIPSTAIDNEHGACPQCGQRTHTVCRNLEHPGQGCPLDVGVDDVLQMADEEGWQCCGRCGNLIERTEGCNQMRCRCGYRFCWGCGSAIGECNCMAAQQNGPGRLQEALEQLVVAAGYYFGPRHDNEEDIMHYDRMMENAGVGDNLVGLVRGYGFAPPPQGEGQGRCPDGQHAQWALRTDGRRVCERCREILFGFIMECEECGLRVCADCRQFV